MTSSVGSGVDSLFFERVIGSLGASFQLGESETNDGSKVCADIAETDSMLGSSSPDNAVSHAGMTLR